MKYLKAQEILPYLPMRWRMTASFNPYVIPIFGKMYYGRIKSIIKLLLETHKNFPNVLEVGGGIGVFSANFKKSFPKSNVYLSDKYYIEAEDLLKSIYSKRFDIHLKYNFGCNIQRKTTYENDFFDLIFALDVLEHIPDPNAALDEIIRILKKDGLLFISVPTESKILRVIRDFFGKIRTIDTDPHWNGMIKSEKEFYKCLKQKSKKILWQKKYPFYNLPKLFSYDMFYLIQK